MSNDELVNKLMRERGLDEKTARKIARQAQTSEIGLTINGAEFVKMKITKLSDDDTAVAAEFYVNKESFRWLRTVEPSDEQTMSDMLNASREGASELSKLIDEMMKEQK